MTVWRVGVARQAVRIERLFYGSRNKKRLPNSAVFFTQEPPEKLAVVVVGANPEGPALAELTFYRKDQVPSFVIET